MFYHDLLKKELFDYINSEYSKKNIKEVPNKSYTMLRHSCCRLGSLGQHPLG